jgi:hypothetical protein
MGKEKSDLTLEKIVKQSLWVRGVISRRMVSFMWSISVNYEKYSKIAKKIPQSVAYILKLLKPHQDWVSATGLKNDMEKWTKKYCHWIK